MSPRHSLAALFALTVTCAVAPGCWFFQKKVSLKDCEKWQEHYKEALGEWADGKLENCGKDKSKEFKKSFSKSMKKNVDDGADGLWTGCKAMADLTVLDSAEGDCFMKGKGPEDWKKCNFKTTGALNMFGISADAYGKSLKSGCGDDAGDDDDDAPKKKKKKKTDDD